MMGRDIWLVHREQPFMVFATDDLPQARNMAALAGGNARVWRVNGIESYERWARDEETQAPGVGGTEK